MLSIKMRMEYVERREKQHILQEEQRVKKLCDDFYEKHPVPVEDCPICFESFPVMGVLAYHPLLWRFRLHDLCKFQQD